MSRSSMTQAWTETAVAAPAPRADAAPLLFLAVAIAVVVRMALPPPLLNLFIAYSIEGGPLYEKIHPGTYLLVALLPVALLLRPLRLYAVELPAVRALTTLCIGILGLSALLVASGRASSAGYFIDTYLSAGAAGLLVFALPEPARRLLGLMVAVVLVLSAMLGIAEAATNTRILPYDMAELSFRPTGLAGHPLMLGLLSCSAVAFLFALPMRWPLRTVFIVILILGTVAAEARFATIMSALAMLLVAMTARWGGLTPRQARRGKLLLILGALLLAVPLVLILQTSGLMSRLNEGLVDESSMARVDVYGVFGYVGLKDILLGADLAWIQAIVLQELGIEIIESTPIVLVFQLGLPGALLFTGLLVFVFARLCRRAPVTAMLGTLVFFITALSNITLSTKTAALMLIVVLLVATQRSASNAPAAPAPPGPPAS